MDIKITQKMQNFIKEQGSLGYVATSDLEGCPNIVTKSLFEVSENNLGYADLYMDRTAENIHQNNKIAIAIINPGKCTGYQFKGHADIITRGSFFDKATKHFLEFGFEEPVHAIKLKVDEIFFFRQGPELKIEVA